MAGPSVPARSNLKNQGKALPPKQSESNNSTASGGRFPIRNAADLDKAISAVGRAAGDKNAIRKFIIKRAKELGLQSKIPDNWNPDGTVGGASGKPAFLNKKK